MMKSFTQEILKLVSIIVAGGAGAVAAALGILWLVFIMPPTASAVLVGIVFFGGIYVTVLLAQQLIRSTNQRLVR